MIMKRKRGTIIFSSKFIATMWKTIDDVSVII